MNALTIILIALAALIALLLIIALFVKKEYAVGREITINKSKPQIFDYIKYVKNHDNFTKWAMMDPGMKKSYRGTDGTPGFVSAWESDHKKVGKGEQEIKSISEGEEIDFKLRFIKPFPGEADAFMRTQTVGADKTKINWGIKSKMNYPMNLMLLFMNMDKIIGNDLQTGLVNLKALVEKKQ